MNRLQERRLELGLTQPEMARQLREIEPRIDVGMISRFERGVCLPTAPVLNGIEAVLQATRSDLFSEDDLSCISEIEATDGLCELTDETRALLCFIPTGAQQDDIEDALYDLVMGNSSGEKMREKIDGGAAYGLDDTDYLLYKLALSMTDQPTDSGKYGSYTNDEVEAAIEMLTGLSDEARGYLWEAQGKNEKSNPWG